VATLTRLTIFVPSCTPESHVRFRALRATQSDEDRSDDAGLPALNGVYGRFGASRTGADLTEERQPPAGYSNTENARNAAVRSR
jgi:hypothetical protein